MSLAGDLMREFEPEIELLELLPSDGGRFEVSVNGRLIYSKLQTQRHAEPGEIIGLVNKMVEG